MMLSCSQPDLYHQISRSDNEHIKNFYYQKYKREITYTIWMLRNQNLQEYIRWCKVNKINLTTFMFQVTGCWTYVTFLRKKWWYFSTISLPITRVKYTYEYIFLPHIFTLIWITKWCSVVVNLICIFRYLGRITNTWKKTSNTNGTN